MRFDATGLVVNWIRPIRSDKIIENTDFLQYRVRYIPICVSVSQRVFREIARIY